MKTQFLKMSALCALMAVAAGCSTMSGSTSGSSPSTPPENETAPPANPGFAAQMEKFNAQFPNDKATKYEEVSINYNNAQKFDDRGNCHDMSRFPVTIALTLDATGKVVSTTTDVTGKKAECFRKGYADVKFPAPPFAPYIKAIKLR